MNGKEMLEAMSFVDEKYIEDADAAPKRTRIHWQGFAAAAACLAVVLVGVWNLNSQKETAEMAAAQDAEIAVYSGDAEMSTMSAAFNKSERSIFIPEMTVQVLSQEGNILHCQVEEPGTGSYEVGQEITVLLPENFQDDLSGRLLISFSPSEDEAAVTADGEITVTAFDWTQLED